MCVNIETIAGTTDIYYIDKRPASLGSVGGWNAFSGIVNALCLLYLVCRRIDWSPSSCTI